MTGKQRIALGMVGVVLVGMMLLVSTIMQKHNRNIVQDQARPELCNAYFDWKKLPGGSVVENMEKLCVLR